MGVSTDGQLCFGIMLEGDIELPWEDDIDEWWRKECGFQPSFNPFTEEGNYVEGVSEHDPRISAYFNEQRVFDNEHPLPFDLVNYCMADYPMYILAAKGSLVEARRGYPKVIDLTMFSKMYDGGAIVKFCEKYDIENTGLNWYLSSYMG